MHLQLCVRAQIHLSLQTCQLQTRKQLVIKFGKIQGAGKGLKRPFRRLKGSQERRALLMSAHATGFQTVTNALDACLRLPKLIVFDLDYTLWPFWRVDLHESRPYRCQDCLKARHDINEHMHARCEMYTTKDKPRLYEDSRPILDACRAKGIPMAIASRTPTPHVAEAFMKKLGITDMFDSIQLIPASSGFDMHSAQKDRAHLPNIKKDTGVEYRDMLFFDDESPNIVKVARLGVTSILVHSGMTCQALQQGLQEHGSRTDDTPKP